MQIGKWLWSGVATITASIRPAISSNSLRKSRYFGTPGNMASISCVCFAPMSTSQSATTSQSPVLRNSLATSAPRLPIPISATPTFSLAPTTFGGATLLFPAPALPPMSSEGIIAAPPMRAVLCRKLLRDIFLSAIVNSVYSSSLILMFL